MTTAMMEISSPWDCQRDERGVVMGWGEGWGIAFGFSAFGLLAARS